MISISIVSHGHGPMIPALINQLLTFPQVGKIILTLNTPESIQLPSDLRLVCISNKAPKGFGANHNAAFEHCATPYFCVLNPDIFFIQNPFPSLLEGFANPLVGLAAPIIKSLDGNIEDSVRHFITPISLMRRYLSSDDGAYSFVEGGVSFHPEWVAGMFMLFNTSTYRDIAGFDENYYLYVEDIDICTRVWLSGKQVLVVPEAAVIHDAQRASRANLRFMRWHISGLIRYFVKYWGRLPKVPSDSRN
jgi:N-acetylglucosaminyl-diphospho-decaprenol L-rhamnosyltransferase